MICRFCGRDINAIGQDNMSRALLVVTLPAAPANPLASSTTLVYKDSGAPVSDTKARDKQ